MHRVILTTFDSNKRFYSEHVKLLKVGTYFQGFVSTMCCVQLGSGVNICIKTGDSGLYSSVIQVRTDQGLVVKIRCPMRS